MIDNKVIDLFNSISLIEAQKASLQSRIDTKLILNASYINSILHELKDDYFIMNVNSNANCRYISSYYDTKTFQFYHDHHNQKGTRVKVRTRLYTENDSSFIEVKNKSKGVTNKKRTETNEIDQLDDKDCKFIKRVSIVNPEELILTLQGEYNRVCLIHKDFTQRVTIDTNIAFSNGNEFRKLSNLAIIEVKQEVSSKRNEVFNVLKKHHAYRTGISKYCIGMLLFHNDLKYNRFKHRLLKINKITGNEYFTNYTG